MISLTRRLSQVAAIKAWRTLLSFLLLRCFFFFFFFRSVRPFPCLTKKEFSRATPNAMTLFQLSRDPPLIFPPFPRDSINIFRVSFLFSRFRNAVLVLCGLLLDPPPLLPEFLQVEEDLSALTFFIYSMRDSSSDFGFPSLPFSPSRWFSPQGLIPPPLNRSPPNHPSRCLQNLPPSP